MNPIDGILRENKTLSEGELELAEILKDRNLCSIKPTDYFRCSYREDKDYHFIPDKSCDAEIPIKASKNKYICPRCERTIYKSDKTLFTRYESTPKPSKILNWFIELCKKIPIDEIKRRPSGRKYGKFRVQPLAEILFDGAIVRVPVLISNFDEELVEWICIHSDGAVPLLTGDAVSLQPRLDELNIPHFSFGKLFLGSCDEGVEQTREIFQIEGEKDKYWNIDHRADQSYAKTEESNLRHISSTDFEYIVHNFLLYSIGSSELFGATKTGAGFPDGVFSLNKPNKLYMWDAKFIRNYTAGDETSLSGEYDKIYRHLVQLRNNEHVRQKFSDVAGIVLFSPRIKPSNVHRLAEFINEQKSPEGGDWSGWVVSFDFDALREIYSCSKRNKYRVLQKANSLQKGLDSLLSNPAKHDKESSPIANSDYQCLNISSDDVELLFEEFIQHQDIEGTEFDREAYETDIEWNY